MPEETPAVETSTSLDDLPSASGPLEVADSSPAEEGTTPAVEDKSTEDDNVPFHKHPRFKRLIEHNKDLKAQLDQLSQRIPQPKAEMGEPPTWFSNLYGKQPELWEEYQKYNVEQQEAYMDKMLVKFEERQANLAKEKEAQQAQLQDWLDDKMTELEDTGAAFDKEELLAVMQQYKPTDAEGNLDFKSGLELLNRLSQAQVNAAVKAEKIEARKGIAAKTTTGDSATPQKPKVDLAKIRKSSWSDLANED